MVVDKWYLCWACVYVCAFKMRMNDGRPMIGHYCRFVFICWNTLKEPRLHTNTHSVLITNENVTFILSPLLMKNTSWNSDGWLFKSAKKWVVTLYLYLAARKVWMCWWKLCKFLLQLLYMFSCPLQTLGSIQHAPVCHSECSVGTERSVSSKLTRVLTSSKDLRQKLVGPC